MRPIRTVAVFPTMFTLGNLVCGFFAIVIASRVDAPKTPQGYPRVGAAVERTEVSQAGPRGDTDPTEDCMKSAWLIFLAMVFDALDGYVARLSRTASDFGAQLDSLCDLMSFGAAPGFLLVKMCPQFAYVHRDAVWVIAASFAACAALRLARFNVETSDDDEHLHFSGLPSPAAAAAIAGFAIMFYTLRKENNPLLYKDQIDRALEMILPFFGVLVALLMVSRIPYPHVVNQVFRGQRSFGHVVAVIFSLVAIMVVRSYAVPIICAGFVFYGPLRFAYEKIVERRHQEEPLF
jgi:CDP-diacylglycerol---serine O-phosphatidyltransferase